MIRRNSYGDFSSESLNEYFTSKEEPNIYSESFNQKETLQCIALSLEAIVMILNDALQSNR